MTVTSPRHYRFIRPSIGTIYHRTFPERDLSGPERLVPNATMKIQISRILQVAMHDLWAPPRRAKHIL